MVTTASPKGETPVEHDGELAHADGAARESSIAASPAVTVTISGDPVRVVVVPDTDFHPENAETANEYRAALNIIGEASTVTQTIADRLMDPLDGAATEGVRRLIAHRRETPPGFMDAVEGYLYGILSAGGAFDPSRGAVIVPPVTRDEFRAAIAGIADLHEPAFNGEEWLAHLYDARPSIGQGYALFKSREDWENFIALLIEENPAARGKIIELQRIFADAAETGLLPAELSRTYAALSREVLAAQEELLTPILEETPGALDPHTRVRIEVRVGHAPKVSVTPYSTEFQAELTRLSGHLLTAENLLPREAAALRAVVRDQAAWCLGSSDSPSWGQPSERWIRANDPGMVIDVQFDCAESVALLGDKRNFELIVSQYLTPQEAADLGAAPPAMAHPSGHGAPESHTPLVRVLSLSGAASYRFGSPEQSLEAVPTADTPMRTPVEQTVEISKRPIFTNVAPLGITHGLGALGAAPADLRAELIRASIAAESLRERSRSDSSTQFLGGETGELTAHGCALTGAIARAAEMPLRALEPLLNVLVGYEAAAALRSGLDGSAERASLGVIRELEQRGALHIDVSSAGLRVSSEKVEVLHEAARALHHQLQLWQLGVSKSSQGKVIDDAGASAGLHEIVRAGWTFARSLDQVTRRRLREEARREVETFFEPSTFAGLIEKLTPLLEALPRERLVALVPNDPDIRALLIHEDEPEFVP